MIYWTGDGVTVHRPGSDVGGSVGAHNEPSQRFYNHGEENLEAVLAAFNQEKALVRAFFVILQLQILRRFV